jgi:hypothetical protein
VENIGLSAFPAAMSGFVQPCRLNKPDEYLLSLDLIPVNNFWKEEVTRRHSRRSFAYILWDTRNINTPPRKRFPISTTMKSHVLLFIWIAKPIFAQFTKPTCENKCIPVTDCTMAGKVCSRNLSSTILSKHFSHSAKLVSNLKHCYKREINA